jgi:hypothetical protein
VLYLSKDTGLYSLDTTTGAAQFIGDTGAPPCAKVACYNAIHRHRNESWVSVIPVLPYASLSPRGESSDLLLGALLRIPSASIFISFGVISPIVAAAPAQFRMQNILLNLQS